MEIVAGGLLLALGVRASLWGSKQDADRWYHLSAFLGGGAIAAAGLAVLIFSSAGT